MIEIMEELDVANNLLQAALERYLSACSAFQACYTRRSGRIPRELSHRVTDELTRANVHEQRIKEAKVAISLSRNCCADIVPIDVLPDEILGRIFHLVLDEEPCTLPNIDGSPSTYLKSINGISHVCSRWRQISACIGTLWSHVDINLVSSEEPESLARATIYAARASYSPLDVHVVGAIPLDTEPGSLITEVASFLASIGPRIRSLKLGSTLAPNRSYTSIIRACFAACAPGALTRLMLRQGPDGYQFFEAAEDPQIPGSLRIDLPKQILEALCHPIKILQLRGFCPPWASKAYHGLTKLCLLSGGYSEICIPEQQLIEILRSSPQLSIFHFDLNITDQLSPDAQIVPAHLECLEVLVWKSERPNQLGTFLRLIAPGLKPLRVSVDAFDKAGSAWLDEIKRFFERSNVTKLCMKSNDSGRISAELLDLLPPLKVLILRRYHVPMGNTPRFTPDGHTNKLCAHSRCPSRFEVLYLLRCLTHVDELQRVIETHSVQTLTVQRGDIFSGSTTPHSYWKSHMSKEEINERLCAICPAAKFVSEEDPSVMEDWNEEVFDLD